MKRYLSKDAWLIEEKKQPFTPEHLQTYESMFTLGNGYLGVRGVMEEMPVGSEPGTFVAGVYDKSAAQVEELINLPNPLDFRVASEGEKLDVSRVKVLKHHRCLDMKKGLLYRSTHFKDARGRKLAYESLRFVSFSNPHLMVMRIRLKAINQPVNITVQDYIDDSVTNQGGILEGRKRHVRIRNVDITDHINYLCLRSYTYNVLIAYSTLLDCRHGNKSHLASSRFHSVNLKKGETVTFTKYITIHTSRDIPKARIKNTSVEAVQAAHAAGFENLLAKNIKLWQQKWQRADIQITGDREIQKALRFNTYHLLISASKWTNDASIPAKTLSGEGYRGHIFWDTEIFMLPFFVYTFPDVAKKLLLYRYKRLSNARKKAAQEGYQGALFPWESASTGDETTPSYSKDLDGSVIEIHTHNYEHHISSDIAYGIYNYLLLTGDKEFLHKYGLEMLLETARFYASRVEYNKKKDYYEIKHVIGPDEFHIDVNNNAFTNYLAKWNLLYALEELRNCRQLYKQVYKRLKKKLKFSRSELESWQYIADNMYMPYSKKRNLIEQFDGYFRKKEVKLKKREQNFMAVPAEELHFDKINQTKYIKQADVVMLLFLFPKVFHEDVIRTNYDYYLKRTLHKSSLSVSIYACVASWLCDKARSYAYFNHSAFTDLDDRHSNTADGIHGASSGGVHQTVIRGFAGIHADPLGISIEPHLPKKWRKVELRISYHGTTLDIKITPSRLELYVKCAPAQKKKIKDIVWRIYNRRKKITPNKKYIFNKPADYKS